MNKKAVILIPALDPPALFADYIQELMEAGFKDIIVVNDGSHDDAVFKKIAALGAVVLTHDINYGKGQGLKTGLSYYQEHFDYNEYAGVITADSDGQHLCKDVIRLANAMTAGEKRLILGSRDFSLEHVPEKSRFGNNTTAWIFKNLLRIKIGDTQTGLRAIPNDLIQPCLEIPGMRFEYETSMLIYAGHHGGIVEIPIETVYYEENKGTHFNPIVDSFKIYRTIFGTFILYILSSTLSWLIDFGLFLLMDKILFIPLSTTGRIALSSWLARAGSSVCNFAMNKKLVFDNKDGTKKSAVRYFILVIVQMMASAGLVIVFSEWLGIEESIVKLVVDIVLFFLSYQIQKHFVFKEESGK